jgi:ribosomal protein S18 acetylase RimI-like enzyme
MNIRIAEATDEDRIQAVLESGRAFLQSQGLSQWQDGYGPSLYVGEDIANNWGYVCVAQDGVIYGYATLVDGVDEGYANIKDGCWDSSHERYISIHSVAIDAGFRGKGFADPFMRGLIEIAWDRGFRDIRIDTHPQNIIMQKVISRCGFIYRGMVEYAIPDGKRKAYQLCR